MVVSLTVGGVEQEIAGLRRGKGDDFGRGKTCPLPYSDGGRRFTCRGEGRVPIHSARQALEGEGTEGISYHSMTWGGGGGGVNEFYHYRLLPEGGSLRP